MKERSNCKINKTNNTTWCQDNIVIVPIIIFLKHNKQDSWKWLDYVLSEIFLISSMSHLNIYMIPADTFITNLFLHTIATILLSQCQVAGSSHVSTSVDTRHSTCLAATWFRDEIITINLVSTRIIIYSEILSKRYFVQLDRWMVVFQCTLHEVCTRNQITIDMFLENSRRKLLNYCVKTIVRLETGESNCWI